MTPPQNTQYHTEKAVRYMAEESKKFPVRKHPRLPHYDYTTANYYFVTICTHKKVCLFGDSTTLSPIGKIAEELLLKVPDHFPGIEIDKYVIMPNHIHAMIILPGGTVELPTIVGQYKGAVTKAIHNEYPNICLWQTSFHDHIVRNQADYERIWTYIDGNPSKWLEDCFYVP